MGQPLQQHHGQSTPVLYNRVQYSSTGLLPVVELGSVLQYNKLPFVFYILQYYTTSTGDETDFESSTSACTSCVQLVVSVTYLYSRATRILARYGESRAVWSETAMGEVVLLLVRFHHAVIVFPADGIIFEKQTMSDRLVKFLTTYAFTIGLAIRLAIAWLFPLLLDDGKLIPGVAYTDVDYHVFSDAANYIRAGESPYQRHTYRYTPFLALILSKVDGRYLFCLADAICGKLILRLQKQPPSLLSCFMWLYNPLAINISTRGSAESFVVLLPVLLTVAITQSTLKYKAILAGLLHGIAVHAKVYPIIYTLSFMVYFGKPPTAAGAKSTPSLSSFITTTLSRLVRPAPMCFFMSFVATFVGLTYLGIVLYGTDALDEGLLYHLTRVDHRHNYSMWWYPIYLARRQTPGMVLLVPQAILLIVTSLGLTDDLGFTLFLQTYMFVTLNKVITAQYFTWYLCLLPLCSFTMTRRLLIATVGVVVSMLQWLACAYLLEMQGWPVHRLVWMASVVYFVANIHLLRVMIQSSSVLRERKTKQS